VGVTTGPADVPELLAGGHREMAGGEVPLGVFAGYAAADARLVAIVEQVITARLVAGRDLAETTPCDASYHVRTDVV